MTDPDEPAKRLYDALRTAGMTPAAWGEWETLATTSPAAQARLRHAAVLLWPEPEQGVPPGEEPVAEQPPCRHKWQLVDYDRLSFKLTLFCCRCGEWKRQYIA